MAEIDRNYVLEQLETNPYWQFRVLDKKWICPYDGSQAVNWRENPDEMADEILEYLTSSCAEFKDGDGETMSFESLKLQKVSGIVKQKLRNEPSWRGKNRDGRWIDPYTGRVTDIVLRDDEPLSRAKVQEFVDYLANLPEFADGEGTEKSVEYLRARHNFFESPAWVLAGPNGGWINPYTTKEVSDIPIGPDLRTEETFAKIWGHLQHCRAYNGGKGKPRPLNELTQTVQRSEKLNQLVAAVEVKFDADLNWQRFNARGLWQCPFCGAELGNVKPPSGNKSNTHMAAVNIAKHLLNACQPFRAISQTAGGASFAELLDRAPQTPMAEAQAHPAGGGNSGFAEAMVLSGRDEATAEPVAVQIGGDPGGGGGDAFAEPVTISPATSPSSVMPAPQMDEEPSNNNISRVIERPNVEARMEDAGTQGGARDRAFEEARRKQLRMLPEPPEIEGMECAVVYQPCDMVGGDFYDFVQLRGDRLGIVQGDVSGHGLEVWGDMTMAMKTLRIYARQSDSAREMLINANEDLVPDLMAKTFVSGFYNILDIESFKMKMARAGHNPLLLFNPRRKPEPLVMYEPKGMVLGMARGGMFANTLEEIEIQLYSGDMLIWYTDGVTETMNPEGDEYGIERFCKVIEEHGQREAEYLLQMVMHELEVFRGDAPPDDDITLIAIRIV
jgi:serine phosphatase RsbU (regulator of sigma subunit)